MAAARLQGLRGPCGTCSRDPDNKARRLLLPGKNNLTHAGDGLAFSIVGERPRNSWESNPVSMSADDALAAEGDKRDQRPGPGQRPAIVRQVTKD